MGITKREIASELGVSKRTVANYIEKLGLGNHVSRNGNTDFLDDFAAAAIADALKNPGKPSRQPADAPAAPAPDSLVDSLAAQLELDRWLSITWTCAAAPLPPGRGPSRRLPTSQARHS